jgi:hypothetical protein
MADPEFRVPAHYWGLLSQDDKSEFTRLHASFRETSDDSVLVLQRHLFLVLNYLRRSPEGLEPRAVVAGVCFAGSFVCVEMRQFAQFLGRARMALVGGFRELGFLPVRVPEQTRRCVLAALPSLVDHDPLLRQWTAQCVPPQSQLRQLCCVAAAALPAIPLSALRTDFLETGPLAFLLLEENEEEFEPPPLRNAFADAPEDEFAPLPAEARVFSDDDGAGEGPGEWVDGYFDAWPPVGGDGGASLFD